MKSPNEKYGELENENERLMEKVQDIVGGDYDCAQDIRARIEEFKELLEEIDKNERDFLSWDQKYEYNPDDKYPDA